MVFGWGLKSFVQAIWAAKRLGIPVLVRGDSQLATPRSALKRTAKDLLYPPLLRTFDAALYVGARSRAYYRHYRFPDQRLFFSPHCVDNAWFAERATGEARSRLRGQLGIGEAESVVLFAGKLQPFKRPLDVVEACARLKTDGMPVRLLIAGSGELAGAIEARAAALGVSLHLLGFQNQTQMPAAYAAADVLMLPSNGSETWGLVCNEALACGRPIAVSDQVGCAEDLAADRRVGQVFPMGQIDRAAAALRRLRAEPRAASDLAGRSAQYSLATAAQGVIAALASVTGRCQS